MKIEMFGLGLPEVKPGDDLAKMLVEAAEREAGDIRHGDIIVVTSKIVSKAYGLLINMREVKPESRAFKMAEKDVAVIISDTEGAPFMGSLDLARGSSDIKVVSRKFSELDRYGKPKFGGVDHVVNELAYASALLMGQTSEGIPG